MSRAFVWSQLAATAAVCSLNLFTPGSARASDLVNGDFSGLAAVGQLCSNARSSGSSAALG